MQSTPTFNSPLQSSAPMLKNYAFKFTRDEEVANDLLQDTLEKALKYVAHFKEGTNINGWLFTIMRNIFINSYRANTRRNAIVTQEEEISSTHLMQSAQRNEAEGKFAMADIQKALASLPECYSIPFLSYFEGYKYEEIAASLNIPIGTVKTRIHMARQLLQKRLRTYRK